MHARLAAGRAPERAPTRRCATASGPGTLYVRHAHGYVPQTLADLGWVGLALSLLALGLWGWAALRAIGLRPRDRGLPWDAERVGCATLFAIALVFGVSSLVDWTWFVPANALMGLLAAAWVIARPPLRSGCWRRRRLRRRSSAVALDRSRAGGPLWAPDVSAPAPAAADVAGPGSVPVAEAHWRRRAPFPWLPAAAALLTVAFALAAAWAAFQPVRSLHAGNEAVERLEQGGLDAAVSIARIAHDRNPLSPEPLWELGFIEQQRGRLANAEDALEEAVRVQPANAETWRRLGRFQLSVLDEPADALASFRAALLPRPAQPGIDVGLPRGEPRQRAAGRAAAR